MATIKRLPSSVVNKIAAGEVIERPASVVKELLENSIDASASTIEVYIEQGGTELLCVVDDGRGIPVEQLELAVTSHATSKIENADDLFCVGTLGFRGEALASIAEVSQLRLRSRTVDQESAFEMCVNGGRAEPPQPCSASTGTRIEVANLFFNTPVRRRFLRTTQTEMGHITEAFARVALASPNVRMSLYHNGKTVHDLQATDKWADRVNNFFGEDIGRSLIPVSGADGPVSIHGFVVDPSHSRGHNRLQYLFLNGRFVRDRSLQHALAEAYRGLLMTGRFPIVFLRLEMPAELVDVNVHPAKLEVRFRDGSRLYSHLLGLIRNKFLTTDLTARAQLGAGQINAQSNTSAAAEISSNAPVATGTEQERMSWRPEAAHRNWTGAPGGGLTHGNSQWADEPSSITPDATRSGQWKSPFDAANEPSDSPPHRPISQPPFKALQIHNRYLVTESDEGVVVIDQHALHERIIYEQLREKVLGGNLESQQLLVPEPVPLASSEAAKVLESQSVLRQLGIQVEDFGGDTVLVAAYPALLANHNPAEMLRDVVELLLKGGRGPDVRDVVDELLHMISCKAAIKAGDKLSYPEITALLEHRQLCQDNHHCPHGRPTALVFSREELDRRFKRI